MRENIFVKFYSFFKRDLPRFFKNIWFFRKQLWEFRGWDYSYNLDLFAKSLEKTAYVLEFQGNEIMESRMLKVEKIKRVIEIINNHKDIGYIELAEKQIGDLKPTKINFIDIEDKPGYKEMVDESPTENQEHNRKVYRLADDIEAEEWKELWRILEGQDHQDYVNLVNSTSEEEKEKTDLWLKWFDGSGMKHWWD